MDWTASTASEYSHAQHATISSGESLVEVTEALEIQLLMKIR